MVTTSSTSSTGSGRRTTRRRPAHGVGTRRAVDDDRRRRRVLPRVAESARRAGDDARARLRPVGPVPAADGRTARRRLPHARARPPRVRPQRQGDRRPRRARPRARRGQVPRRPRHRAGDPGRELDGMPRHLRVRLPLSRPPRTGGPRLSGRRHLQPAAPPRHGTDQPRRAARAGAAHGGRDPRLRAVRRPEHRAHVQVAHAVSVARAPARDGHPDPRGARRPRSADAGCRRACRRWRARPTTTC